MSPPNVPSFVPPDWPHRKSSRAVEAGDVHWHVQQAGEGPVVLLLHGSGASSHSWADLVPVLARHATVIAPDLPGHGFSTSTEDNVYTLSRVSEALEALLQKLSIGPVRVVARRIATA